MQKTVFKSICSWFLTNSRLHFTPLESLWERDLRTWIRFTFELQHSSKKTNRESCTYLPDNTFCKLFFLSLWPSSKFFLGVSRLVLMFFSKICDIVTKQCMYLCNCKAQQFAEISGVVTFEIMERKIPTKRMVLFSCILKGRWAQ